MSPMPYTAKQLQSLRLALARGEHRVTFGDRMIEYRSVDELRSAIREIEAALATAAGRPRVRHVRIHTSKGFA